MTDNQKYSLTVRQTDLAGALQRFCGDEKLYVTCLREFLNDPTFMALSDAIKRKSWDEAFTAAHALKGLAGNMGFIPLMHVSGQLVVLIRGGRLRELGEAISKLNSAYRDITDAITANFTDDICQNSERKSPDTLPGP